jgi:hypothetical protein
MNPLNDTPNETLFEELHHRANDGIEVSLLWNRADNSLTVILVDTRLNRCFELPVAGKDALDAFNHPYAYAAFRGLAIEVPERTEREFSIH